MSTDWAKTFRALSKGESSKVVLGQLPNKSFSQLPSRRSGFVRLENQATFGVDFGTALDGDHSAHELSDLLTAKTQEINDITAHIATLPAHPDPTWQAWIADWGRFQSDWHAAAAQAQAVVNAAKTSSSFSVSSLFSSSDAPWDNTYVESDYQALLNVLAPNGAGTSRLQDLYNRYTNLPTATPVPFKNVPQPTAPDVSMVALSATNRAAQAMPPFVKAAVGAIAPDLVPQDKTKPDYDPTNWLKKNWKPLAAVGGGLLVANKVLSKFGL